MACTYFKHQDGAIAVFDTDDCEEGEGWLLTGSTGCDICDEYGDYGDMTIDTPEWKQITEEEAYFAAEKFLEVA